MNSESASLVKLYANPTSIKQWNIEGDKKSNSSADTSELEKQIDAKVYELYGLVEGNEEN